jgi:hypothetical protein
MRTAASSNNGRLPTEARSLPLWQRGYPPDADGTQPSCSSALHIWLP